MREVRYIYVIGSERGPFKIGMAVSPHSRLNELKTGSYVPLAVKHTAAVPYRVSGKVEHSIHLALRAHRLQGEWFSVTLPEAIAAVDRAVAEQPEMPPAPPKPAEPEPPNPPPVKTFQVHGVELIRRVTLDQKIAEDTRIQMQRASEKAARDAPKIAFSQRMADGKRHKGAALLRDTAALQSWLNQAKGRGY